MFDSLTIACQLTDIGIDRGHADALADAIRQAAEHVRRGFDAGIAELRAEITALESRIYRAMLVQAGATAGALVSIAGIAVGALRLLGDSPLPLADPASRRPAATLQLYLS